MSPPVGGLCLTEHLFCPAACACRKKKQPSELQSDQVIRAMIIGSPFVCINEDSQHVYKCFNVLESESPIFLWLLENTAFQFCQAKSFCQRYPRTLLPSLIYLVFMPHSSLTALALGLEPFLVDCDCDRSH